jgi:hypothetical protein
MMQPHYSPLVAGAIFAVIVLGVLLMYFFGGEPL